MADNNAAIRQYRMVYTGGSAAPVLDPVPKKKQPDKKQQPQRTKQQEEHLRRQRSIARRNQQHAQVMNRSYVMLLSVASLLCAVICGFYVQLRAEATTHMQKVSTLQATLTELRTANDAAETALLTSASLTEIKKAATEMGLSYPDSDQVVYYSIEDEDYMITLANE